MLALGLLATAVAGRDVPVELGTRGVHSDGYTIFVPGAADPAAPQIADAVICQAALLATDSLSADRMKRVARSGTGVAERYLALEVVRSCVEVEHVLPSRLRAALGPYVDAVGLTASADESLRRALRGRAMTSPPVWFGELHPRLVGPAERAATEATEDDVDQAIRRALAEEADEDDGDGAPSQLARLLSSPVKNPLGSLLMGLLGARRSAGDGESGGSEISSVGRRSGQGAGWATSWRPTSTVHNRSPLRGHRYPEWDHRKGRYRDDWCTVGEYDPAPGDGTLGPSRGDSALLRELAAVSRGYRTHHRQVDGGELDLDALVEHRVGVRSGTSAEPHVYQADLRTVPDLGVLVLLDATGSTTERTGDTSLFETQRQLANALTTALDRLGSRVGAFAFYSRGRGNVRYLRCKTFDEQWGIAAQRRMSAVEPSGFTRLGAAIRHGSRMLDTQAGTRRRLLVVIGDGIAYDDGYEGSYAVEDARRAVAEAGARGVACVGISAAPPPQDAVWRPEASLVVTEPDELARGVRRLLATALHAAERPQSVS